MPKETAVPRAFFWRRIHSLTGLWLVVFIIEHLLTNSQAALWIGDDGSGFVRGVNFLQSLPYLHVIEVVLLGVPIFIHAIWGIKYLRTSQYNSLSSDGSIPSLTEYPRNKAYTWQRMTSWIILFGIVAHVVQMRFMDYPNSAQLGDQHYYMVRLDLDDGLYTLADRLNVELYDQQRVQHLKGDQNQGNLSAGFLGFMWGSKEGVDARGSDLVKQQGIAQKESFIQALEEHPLEPGQVVAVAKNFGTAELLAVRETFKKPIMILLYTLFVMATCFHAFNGLWTFCITWGLTLTERSQRIMHYITTVLMVLVTFLGLAAVWGSYWINLKF